ncbi:hypothetical protein HAX54_002523 [Datura stramonium]|uniref:SAC domain-containing protein n=1 Tax=Datura stramonium TaxID=4076 RepID=A0ABS8WUC8_DATST|nr:hypothetical protein [Datura stramonium]
MKRSRILRNDVETEQILFEDVPEDFPVQISSVVQNRGSIPLFWFQETSRLNLKPDIAIKATNVLFSLGKVAAYALNLTGDSFLILTLWCSILFDVSPYPSSSSVTSFGDYTSMQLAEN